MFHLWDAETASHFCNVVVSRMKQLLMGKGPGKERGASVTTKPIFTNPTSLYKIPKRKRFIVKCPDMDFGVAGIFLRMEK